MNGGSWSGPSTAHHTGHSGVQVFSTPPLILAMEMACTDAWSGRLPTGYNHVGVRNEIAHLAPTPVGLLLVATAELVEVDGRRLAFLRVEAHDSVEKVGEGRQERMVVNWPRFMERVEEKRRA